MADEADQHDSVGAWAKKYHLTSRALIESTLREHDLGPTQWYVLHQLVHAGPTLQRDLGQLLQIERATLSGIIATLVRKGLVTQTPDAVDQRQQGRAVGDQDEGASVQFITQTLDQRLLALRVHRGGRFVHHHHWGTAGHRAGD